VRPVQIFLCFDCDHDRDLSDRLLAQSRDTTLFAISDQSEGGVITDAWSERARTRISSSDEVVVLCGEHTDSSPCVNTELRIAREMSKPYVLVWGRRECMCKRPRSARSSEAMYMWNMEVLEGPIASLLPSSRRARGPRGLTS
jgi:hypothetical protein